MKIEIRKAAFVNKGAELMLHAILQKMRERYPAAIFVMSPTLNSGSSPYIKRAELGLFQKAFLGRIGAMISPLASTFAASVLEKYGVIPEKDIDIVIDAAGFAYSDQWGVKNCRKLADACRRWKSQGKKVILLPQAFGPFALPQNKENIRVIADHCDLIFARDLISYEFLTKAVGERQNIKMAPDFTNLVRGAIPDGFDSEKNRFCIVPNFRMIDKTDSSISKAYLPFLIACAKYLRSKEAKPFLLVHEGENDLALAQEVRNSVGSDLAIVKQVCPLKIKGILGSCSGTIGSRFHGLVSSLSQGVPSLGAGWSHKYQMLFEDYGFPEGIIQPDCSEKDIHKKIDMICDDNSRQAIAGNLTNKSCELKALSEQMWDSVFAVCEEDHNRVEKK